MALIEGRFSIDGDGEGEDILTGFYDPDARFNGWVIPYAKPAEVIRYLDLHEPARPANWRDDDGEREFWEALDAVRRTAEASDPDALVCIDVGFCFTPHGEV